MTSSGWSTPPTSASATRCSSDEHGRVPADPELRPRALLGGPGPRHRPVQAVPQGHRPARRGGRGAGAARPRPRRPGAVLAAVGPMQFDVAVHRLENEFGAPVELSPTGVHGRPPHRRRAAPMRCGPCAASTCSARRRHAARPVREPLLARPPARRAARAHARPLSPSRFAGRELRAADQLEQRSAVRRWRAGRRGSCTTCVVDARLALPNAIVCPSPTLVRSTPWGAAWRPRRRTRRASPGRRSC